MGTNSETATLSCPPSLPTPAIKQEQNNELISTQSSTPLKQEATSSGAGNVLSNNNNSHHSQVKAEQPIMNSDRAANAASLRDNSNGSDRGGSGSPSSRMMTERRDDSMHRHVNSSQIDATNKKMGDTPSFRNNTGVEGVTNSARTGGSDSKSQSTPLGHHNEQRHNISSPLIHLPPDRHPHPSYHHLPPPHPNDRPSNGRTSPGTQSATGSVSSGAAPPASANTSRHNPTVSRRGGRTSASSRSRSPYPSSGSSVMGQPGNPGTEGSNDAGRSTPLGMNSNPQHGPHAPGYFKDRKETGAANPSSAAAAAAAAAAAIVRNPRGAGGGPPSSRYYDEQSPRHPDGYNREEYFDRQGPARGKDGEFYDRRQRDYTGGREGPSHSGHYFESTSSGYSNSDSREGKPAHPGSQHPKDSEDRDGGNQSGQGRRGNAYPPHYNHPGHPSREGNPQDYRGSEDAGGTPSSHRGESRSGPGPSQRAFEADYPPYSRNIGGVNNSNDYGSSRGPYNRRQDMPPPSQQQPYRGASSVERSGYSRYNDVRYEGDSGNVSGPSPPRPFDSSREGSQYEGYHNQDSKLSRPRSDSPVDQFNYNRSVNNASDSGSRQTRDHGNNHDPKYPNASRENDDSEYYRNNRGTETIGSLKQSISHHHTDKKYFEGSHPVSMEPQDVINTPAHRNPVTPSSRGEGPPSRSTTVESSSGGGGMSRIMGGSTPLHLRVSDAPHLSQSSNSRTSRNSITSRNSSSSRPGSRNTNKSSVFRGTSTNNSSSNDAHRRATPTIGSKSREADVDHVNSSKPIELGNNSMLLTLKSQGALSFDTSPLPPNSTSEGTSPENPPKMHRQNHQQPVNNMNNNPAWSPKSQLTLARSGSHNVAGASSHGIEMAPSFTLFNTSFDSLGDVMAGQAYTSSAGAFGLDGVFNSFANSQDLGDRANHQSGVGHNPSMGNLGAMSFSSVYQNKNDNENEASNVSGREDRPYPARGNMSLISQSGSNIVPLLNPGVMSQGSMSLMMLSSPNNSFGGGLAIQQASANIGGNVNAGVSNIGGSTVVRLGDPSSPPRSNSYVGTPATSPTHSSSTRNRGNTQALTPQDRQHHPLRHISHNTPPHDPNKPSPDRSTSTLNSNTAHSTSHVSNASANSSRSGTPPFYAVLIKNRSAFMQCTFILPGIRRAMERDVQGLQAESSKSNQSGDIPEEVTSDSEKAAFIPSPSTSPTRKKRKPEPTPADITTSTRRVASAICVFGGSKSRQSIFRSTGRPSATQPYSQKREELKRRYEQMLPSRYYENENRLSWEFEETPPVEDVTDNETEEDDNSASNTNGADFQGDGMDYPNKKIKTEDSNGQNNDGETSNGNANKDDGNIVAKNGERDESGNGGSDVIKNEEGMGGNEKDQPKMKYRCKLCGQPKQNHVCTYQQSLQRSIGIMVYPSVNAFTASEPGELAPALSEMNNFVSTPETGSSVEMSPERPSPRRYMPSSSGRNPIAGGGGSSSHSSAIRGSSSHGGVPNVTPESTRSGMHPLFHSPGSALSSLESPQRIGYGRDKITPPSTVRSTARSPHRLAGATRKMDVSSPESGEGLLFVEAVDLKPEQYRIITQKEKPTPGAFIYPSLPLPYAQRKSLSDNLFALSKEKAHLTDECAVVLREAREKDMWDLAVAELMTQVAVVLHCQEDDFKFDGLRQYLLTLGIAC